MTSVNSDMSVLTLTLTGQVIVRSEFILDVIVRSDDLILTSQCNVRIVSVSVRSELDFIGVIIITGKEQ
jgi:hypothetical protein